MGWASYDEPPGPDPYPPAAQPSRAPATLVPDQRRCRERCHHSEHVGASDGDGGRTSSTVSARHVWRHDLHTLSTDDLAAQVGEGELVAVERLAANVRYGGTPARRVHDPPGIRRRARGVVPALVDADALHQPPRQATSPTAASRAATTSVIRRPWGPRRVMRSARLFPGGGAQTARWGVLDRPVASPTPRLLWTLVDLLARAMNAPSIEFRRGELDIRRSEACAALVISKRL